MKGIIAIYILKMLVVFHWKRGLFQKYAFLIQISHIDLYIQFIKIIINVTLLLIRVIKLICI